MTRVLMLGSGPDINRSDTSEMRYMVVETYMNGPEPVYERLAAQGRLLPPGLTYVDSRVEAVGRSRCCQLMETDDPTLFDIWIDRWSDLVAFEVVPVISSTAAAASP